MSQPRRQLTSAPPAPTASLPTANDSNRAAADEQANIDWMSRQQTAAHQSSSPSVATIAHRIASADQSAEGELASSLSERATAAADGVHWATPLSFTQGSTIDSLGAEDNSKHRGHRA